MRVFLLDISMIALEQIFCLLGNLNPWWILGIHTLICGFLVLFFLRTWGVMGLYIYSALASIASNIAVLKLVPFPLYDRPIALGTVFFMSLFLCNDLAHERYGKKEAARLIWVGFISYFVFSFFMGIIVSYKTFSGSLEVQEALKLLFIPAPSIFCASIIAYFLSQYTDMFLYQLIHKITGEKLLWVRSGVSTLFGAFLDNTIFSILLWYVFMPYAKEFEDVFWTYIMGVFLMRILLSFVNTVFMYLSKKRMFYAVS